MRHDDEYWERMADWAEHELEPGMGRVVLTGEDAIRHGREMLAIAFGDRPQIAQRKNDEPHT